MRKLLLLAWLVVGAGMIATPACFAQASTSNPEVSVRSVRFSYPRIDGQQGPAMEAEVELEVRGSGNAGGNPRFVDNVRVALMLAIQSRGRSPAEFQYYYADAEAITLETGTRTMRFYLPADVVRRDNLSGDPYAYSVELAIAGRVLPPQRANLSETLRARDRFDVFQQKVTEARSVTDGVLVPQHQFQTGHRDGRETPSVVRRTGR